MTAFAPPDFVFNGINFNPNFYDNPLLTAGSGSIPNPLPVAQLNTNSIQALNNVVPVNLYTTFTDVLTLGNSLVTNMIIESGSALSILATTLFNIGSSALTNLVITAQLIGLVSSEIFFTDLANNCRFTFYPNDTYPSIQFNSSTSGGFQDASIEVNPKITVPTGDFEGTINLRGETLKTPQTITSLTPASVINLFTDQTTSISLGNSGITLRSPNTIVGQLSSSPQNLFTTTTGQISLGGASTLRLSTPTTIVSSAIASVLNLFATQTSQINLGDLMATLATPLTLITSSISSVLNLFATQTGQINLGASSSTLVLPNTIQSLISTAQTLFTNHTSNITLGGTSVPTLELTGTAINLNSTNGLSNNVYVGGSNTAISDMRGADVNVNSNYLATNTVEIGSSFSTNTILGVTNINTTGTLDTTIGGAGGDVSITSAAGITLNGGIKLGGSNFTGNIKIAFGRLTSTPAIGGGFGIGSQFVGFGTTFGGVPQVFLSVQKSGYTGTISLWTIQLDAVPLTTSFYWACRNNSTAAPINSYQVNWFAIGQY